jgi:hypothetical protein
MYFNPNSVKIFSVLYNFCTLTKIIIVGNNHQPFILLYQVPIYEERKSNPRNSYLEVLARIVESLYSGSNSPISGLVPAYARSGSAS